MEWSVSSTRTVSFTLADGFGHSRSKWQEPVPRDNGDQLTECPTYTSSCGYRCRAGVSGTWNGVGPLAIIADQHPHDVDETAGQSYQRVDSRSFLATLALVELSRRSIALGAVERSHVKHFPEAAVVALRSAQGAVSVA